ARGVPTMIASWKKVALVGIVLLGLLGAGIGLRSSPGAGAAPPSALPEKNAADKPPARPAPAKGRLARGKVLLPDGRPAANATLVVRQLPQHRHRLPASDTILTKTSPDGRFEVEAGERAQV